MTTVPGHNQILQQSGVAQELSQQSQTPKPAPEQAAAVQQTQQTVKNTTVQRSEKSEHLKKKKKRNQRKKDLKQKTGPRSKKAKDKQPGDPGHLLDTTA